MNTITSPEMLLEVRDLRVLFATAKGSAAAVDGVSFDVRRHEVLGIVGESGSGKSVTLRSILRLSTIGGQVSGSVVWADRDLMSLSEREMRTIRGREISMIFQEPMTALNPVLTVGEQIRDNLEEHTTFNAEQRRQRAVELLELVGIADPDKRIHDYPHEFSGGMRQRVMIAISLASSPKLLLADEPTTALDVTIQDQVLKLILRLRDELDMGVILVTHDLGVVAQTCDRVVVMYAGRVVESGSVVDVFARPQHAYTLGLLNSVPLAHKSKKTLQPIPGTPPDIGDRSPGCPFAPRCSLATDECDFQPPMKQVSETHRAACWHHEKVAEGSRAT
jgi:peptide/nickel transport system ATP-binding protein